MRSALAKQFFVTRRSSHSVSRVARSFSPSLPRASFNSNLVFSTSGCASIAFVTGGVIAAATRSIRSSSGGVSSGSMRISGSRICRIKTGTFSITGSGGCATVCPHAIFCPVPQARKWNFELPADFRARPTSEMPYSRASLREGETAKLFRTIPAGSMLSFDETPKRTLLRDFLLAAEDGPHDRSSKSHSQSFANRSSPPRTPAHEDVVAIVQEQVRYVVGLRPTTRAMRAGFMFELTVPFDAITGPGTEPKPNTRSISITLDRVHYRIRISLRFYARWKLRRRMRH